MCNGKGIKWEIRESGQVQVYNRYRNHQTWPSVPGKSGCGVSAAANAAAALLHIYSGKYMVYTWAERIDIDYLDSSDTFFFFFFLTQRSGTVIVIVNKFGHNFKKTEMQHFFFFLSAQNTQDTKVVFVHSSTNGKARLGQVRSGHQERASFKPPSPFQPL